MSKNVNLSIPEPCHEGWQHMTPTEKGRFCASCQKEVVDFSEMSDRQLAAFFKSPESSVCGRFRADQLDHDLALPKNSLPWIKYFFQITLPAFLFSVKGSAQMGKVKTEPDTIMLDKALAGVMGFVSTKHAEPPKDIKGKVLDQNGEPIPYASVYVKGTRIGAITDSTGSFSMLLSKSFPITLVASAIGNEAKEMDIQHSNVTFILPRTEVVMSLGIVFTTTKKKKPIPVIQRISDTVFTRFKIYPNPVTAGRKVVIEWKRGEKGTYTLALTSLNGQLLLTKEVMIDSKTQLISLDIPVTPPGTYVVSFRNTQKGKLYSQQLLVQ